MNIITYQFYLYIFFTQKCILSILCVIARFITKLKWKPLINSSRRMKADCMASTISTTTFSCSIQSQKAPIVSSQLAI